MAAQLLDKNIKIHSYKNTDKRTQINPMTILNN